MSIYTECSKAAREIVRRNEPFTDLDIIRLAESPDWTEKNHEQARHDAAQIAAAFFRAERLVRFGPVEYGPEPDYARGEEGHLIYAPAMQVKCLHTPNGDFEDLWYSDDPIAKNGRRKGSTRNDLEPWSAQSPVTAIERATTPSAPEREVARLTQSLQDAHARIDEMQAELERMRTHAASGKKTAAKRRTSREPVAAA